MRNSLMHHKLMHHKFFGGYWARDSYYFFPWTIISFKTIGQDEWSNLCKNYFSAIISNNSPGMFLDIYIIRSIEEEIYYAKSDMD
jgi:hypothetical protein